jgi:hypothetical protein
MMHAARSSQVLIARLAAVLIVVFIVVGLIWYGISGEVQHRIWRDIAERPGGPMTFRFVLQPCMAAFAAWRDARKDARTGRSPYLWSLLTESAARAGELWEGLIATGQIILLGLAMDTAYQFIVLKTFYPGEAVIIALILAFLPYLFLRGPFARLQRRHLARRPDGSRP